MSRADARLTPAGRLILVQRVADGRARRGGDGRLAHDGVAVVAPVAGRGSSGAGRTVLRGQEPPAAHFAVRGDPGADRADAVPAGSGGIAARSGTSCPRAPGCVKVLACGVRKASRPPRTSSRRRFDPWVSGVVSFPKRLLVGLPLRSSRLGETLLPKRLALLVFCSDPISSNAYATEEIVLMLSVGGLALLHLTPWVAAAVVVLLSVVVISCRQTCHDYPNGGGACAVSRANLGQNAALVAAAALLIDYVLTVAVSVAAGVANLISAFPGLAPNAVGPSLALVATLAVANLRGLKESGRAFAIPTYGFVLAVFSMIVVGLARSAVGSTPTAESAHLSITATNGSLGGLVLVSVVLRSFASGCTALTGVEAVSNGVPNFRPPKSKNAAGTLAIMAWLTVTMFIGITALALASRSERRRPEELDPAGLVRCLADPAEVDGRRLLPVDNGLTRESVELLTASRGLQAQHPRQC